MNTDVDELLAREDADGEAGKLEAPPPRPSLVQFTNEKLPEPEPDRQEDSAGDEKKLEATDAKPEDENATPAGGNRDGHAEAYELGVAKRQDGKPKVPPPKMDPAFIEAFEAGWTKEDESRKTGKLV